MTAAVISIDQLPKDPHARLELAANHLVNDWATQRARTRIATGGVGGPLDEKRSQAYCEYGFPGDIDFERFENLYRRSGTANGAVKKVINKCWSTDPEVIEGDEEKDKTRKTTPWEQAFKDWAKPLKLWRVMREVDRRRLVGRFAGIIIQFRGAGAWKDPVRATKPTVAKPTVAKLIPAWEGELTPRTFDEDVNSETYGEPLTWQFKEPRQNNVGGRDIEIHRDRIFIFGDLSSHAVGFLEPAYNNFVSLEKIEGGAGEGFLKNAARQLSVNFDPEVNLAAVAQAYNVEVKDLRKVFDSVARDVNRGSDTIFATQGANVTALTANMPDPSPSHSVNVQSAAAGLNIPTKILIGMQTGERASTEDVKEFNATCQSRRGDLADEQEDFVRKLIALKVISPIAEFNVVWDDLTTATAAEKLANAKTLSEINNNALATGGELFSGNEVRDAAGYDPEEGLDDLAEPTLPEGGPGEDDEDADPNAPPADPDDVPPGAGA